MQGRLSNITMVNEFNGFPWKIINIPNADVIEMKLNKHLKNSYHQNEPSIGHKVSHVNVLERCSWKHQVNFQFLSIWCGQFLAI